MACCGEFFTVCLGADGIVYSFGVNYCCQLGLGSAVSGVTIPKPLKNLPKIKQVSCGREFTVCIDEEGSIWSFGSNYYGQLGTGNRKTVEIPQKIKDIPSSAQSVSCGAQHTLIITDDLNLWSFGLNEQGQLFQGNIINPIVNPKQTSFTNVIKISAGGFFSLLQNMGKEIYGCGQNCDGQLGFIDRNFENSVEPILIPNQPPNIIQLYCGIYHTLLLDSDGNVFSFGYNYYGNLGIGHNEIQIGINHIRNIPFIRDISCVGDSNYLIDVDGNLWSFGSNFDCQLGLDDEYSYIDPVVVPTKSECLKDIKQISSGCFGSHLIAKNYFNCIFVVGNNKNGQLGIENTDVTRLPKEMHSKYFKIWGECNSRAKSARK